MLQEYLKLAVDHPDLASRRPDHPERFFCVFALGDIDTAADKAGVAAIQFVLRNAGFNGPIGTCRQASAKSLPHQVPPAYMERFVGSVRRECLDHVLVLNESGLRRVLQADRHDDERSRTHLALAKDLPIPRPIMGDGVVVAIPEIGGLHHRYERQAARKALPSAAATRSTSECCPRRISFDAINYGLRRQSREQDQLLVSTATKRGPSTRHSRQHRTLSVLTGNRICAVPLLETTLIDSRLSPRAMPSVSEGHGEICRVAPSCFKERSMAIIGSTTAWLLDESDGPEPRAAGRVDRTRGCL
jgi:hypothetical protein